MGDLCNHRILGDGVCQEQVDVAQRLLDRVHRGPIEGFAASNKNVECWTLNNTVTIDIAMVNLRCEAHLWWPQGVVCREIEAQEENTWTLVSESVFVLFKMPDVWCSTFFVLQTVFGKYVGEISRNK